MKYPFCWIKQTLMEQKNKSKFESILEIERIYKNEIKYNQENKPKYFVTFPYPYMNGKLHLGHLFSFTKSEFMARYKLMKGFEVFFPLSFHGSGMPIAAVADKLVKGDEKQIQLMKSIGIVDIELFKDPNYWLYFFCPLAQNVLTQFQSYVNWNHSFTTTELNPFYDSFVKWQFHKLENFISYGKKETIFCPITNQPCLDHDRRTGEGVIPFKVDMKMIRVNDIFICARVKEQKKAKNEKNDNFKTISLSIKSKFFKVKLNDKICIIDQNALENMKYQEFKYQILEECILSEIPQSECVKINCVQNEIPPLVNVNDPNDTVFSYFEPEKEVQGRTGAKCVVALFSQYFLDYDKIEWKNKVRECVSYMTIHNETRKMLLDALDWIDKWGFSRTFGIGTRYKNFLIDSLSDSTIYMALYTVRNEIFSDIFGKESKIDFSFLTNDAWNYIFDLNKINPYSDQKGLVLERARKCFMRYYPVDLRVSGKDLIKNHLIFFLFNHVAIFPKKYWPKRIFTNGHLMLNNAKMSKSEGNFLTAEDSLNLYGANISRIVLADAGDFNEDANFSESLADNYILKLHAFIQFIDSHCMKDKNKNFDDIRAKNKSEITEFLYHFNETKKSDIPKENINFADSLLKDGVEYLVHQCDIAYESMSYRNVVKYGFHEFKTLVELCLSLQASNQSIIYAIKMNLLILLPMIPSISEYFLEKYFDEERTWPFTKPRRESLFIGLEWYKKLFRTIFNKLNKSKKKKIKIFIGQEKAAWKTEVDKIDRNDIRKLHECFKQFSINPKKGMSYVMDRTEYFFNEKQLLFGMKEDLGKKLSTTVDFVFEEGRGEPYEPEIIFY